jgi:hypothetical protein
MTGAFGKPIGAFRLGRDALPLLRQRRMFQQERAPLIGERFQTARARLQAGGEIFVAFEFLRVAFDVCVDELMKLVRNGSRFDQSSHFSAISRT